MSEVSRANGNWSTLSCCREGETSGNIEGKFIGKESNYRDRSVALGRSITRSETPKPGCYHWAKGELPLPPLPPELAFSSEGFSRSHARSTLRPAAFFYYSNGIPPLESFRSIYGCFYARLFIAVDQGQNLFDNVYDVLTRQVSCVPLCLPFRRLRERLKRRKKKKKITTKNLVEARE